MIEIVPATKEHIIAMYGKSLGRSVQALAVVDGDRVLGVGGIYRTGGTAVVFTNMSDELRKRPRKLIEAARIILGWVNDRAVAVCDPQVKTAQQFLEHFGFAKMEGDVWQRHYRS